MIIYSILFQIPWNFYYLLCGLLTFISESHFRREMLDVFTWCRFIISFSIALMRIQLDLWYLTDISHLWLAYLNCTTYIIPIIIHNLIIEKEISFWQYLQFDTLSFPAWEHFQSDIIFIFFSIDSIQNKKYWYMKSAYIGLSINIL